MHAPPGFTGRFLTDHRTRCAYAEAAGPYRIVPDAVAVPDSVDDVVALVRAAGESGWAMVPRGAGSGMPGGNVGHGVVVDLQRLRDPQSITRGRADVGPAVTWREVDRLAAPHGLRLPPDPSSGAFCTIGGMVATNAAGGRTVRYGPMRPWVHALEMVAGDGSLLHLTRDGARAAPDGPEARLSAVLHPAIHGAATTVRERFPKTRKNSAGYALDQYLDSGNLIDLVIGSEGTLGIITRVTVTLDERPAAVSSLLVALPDLDGLSEAVRTVGAFGPAAVEFLDRSYLRIAEYDRWPTDDWAGALLLDFEGHANETAAVAEAAADAVRPMSLAVHTAATAAERDHLWALRHAASPVLARLPDTRRSLQVIEDGCVPIDQLGRYITSVHAVADDLGVPVVAFGHAGDGHLHVNALVDTTDPECRDRIRTLVRRVTRLVIDLGGTPSGEHGDGRLRTDGVADLYGPAVMDLFRLVKSTFDPAGIMNPGVIVGDATDTITDLKVGPDAQPLPADIALALRQIERTGGWGTSRLELPAADPLR